MVLLRTPEGHKKYMDFLATNPTVRTCPMCKEQVLKSFNFWKIVDNDFPYDVIAGIHHMLVPIRHVTEDKLTQEELTELRALKKDYINENYDYIIEPAHRNKSVPHHFHLHLIIPK